MTAEDTHRASPPSDSEAPSEAQAPADDTPRPPSRRLLWLQIALLVVAMGGSIAAIPFAGEIRAVGVAGFLLLFILSVQSGALFMLPGFGFASIGAFTIVFGDPWLPALVGTTGQVIGEMVSYLLGATGSPWIRRQQAYRRVENWIKRWGLLVVFVIAATPNPVFDIAGAVAGAAGLGWKRFFVASWAGRLIKNVLIAFLALGGAALFERWLS
ncbi:MAG: VTT domain-containing protein [Chloroflexi bacterium]|nr:VTT domain-containing protein [Chloroflexota bacterium]